MAIADGNSLQSFVETCNNSMFVEAANKTVGLIKNDFCRSE